MRSELSKYLLPEVLERMDREFALFIRYEQQRAFHRQLLLRERPRIGSQHVRMRDRYQAHQRWPQGAIQYLARQEVIK